MKNIQIYMVLIIAMFCSVELFSLDSSKDVFCKYAILYKDKNKQVNLIDPYNPNIELKANDQVKVYLNPGEGSYVYLLLKDSYNELYTLFPPSFQDFENNYFDREYYIPRTSDWLILDQDSGTETFYLMVSNKRLYDLENLISDYRSVKKSDKNIDQILQTKQRVIEKMREYRLTNSFFQGNSENIVLVACEFRGSVDLFKFSAIDIEVDNFYAKTFKIKH